MLTFIEFLSQQWMLVGAWLALVALLLTHENRKAGQSVLPQQVSNLLNTASGKVVDIRDSNEFRQGHIIDAINIPERDLEKRLVELNEYKDTPLIVVCKIGQNAGAVSKQLKAQGFTAVYKLTGGISEWTAANFPLVK